MRLVEIGLLILSSALGFFLAIFIARRRRGPGSQALAVVILGATVWSLCYAFEIIASSLTYKLFWERFEFFGMVSIPLAWFIFVAQYSGYPQWMKRILNYRIPLTLIPVVTLALVWTNDLHNLIWQQVYLERIGPLVALGFERGPWFWVLIGYSYVLLFLGSVQLVNSIFSIIRLQRWQVFLALLAILLPWIGNIYYISGSKPEHYLDWTAFLFLLSGLLFSLSLFRFQLANILPIAQEAVFAGLKDCVLVLDTVDTIVEMNPSAKKRLDRPALPALGKNISEVVPELAPHVKQARYSDEYKAEYSQEEEAGREYYDLRITLLHDPYKNPIGHLVVFHEITELKRNQAELEMARDQLENTVSERTEALKQAIAQLENELVQRSLAEKRFEDVIESAPDAMFVLDQSGKILLINAMAEKLFGYTRQELVGMVIGANLIPDKYLEEERKYFIDFLHNPPANQSSFGVDLYAMRKDGSEFPIEVDLSRLDDSQGFWVAINVRDISERKRVEAELRDREQTYRALFENAGDAIFLTSVDGKILHVNSKACELLGYSQAELESKSIFDVILPEELAHVRENIELLSKGGRLRPYIRYYLKKSGEVLPAENNTVMVRDADGKPKFMQNIARDISERIKAERAQVQLLGQIRQSNEQMRNLALRLQEVQELERQALAAVLHDRVGQNLTGLNLNLKILQNQLQDGSGSEVRKRLADSLTLVEETTHKIRDVMADLNPPVLDEYGLVAAVKWYCGDFTTRTGITAHVSSSKDEQRLDGSVERILFRLVQEALMNVAKHAQASQVLVSVESNQDAVNVMVKDNGVGFDPQAAKVATSEPHWGLLSMQRKAASIGADLSIESTPGVGTTVSINVRRQNGN